MSDGCYLDRLPNELLVQIIEAFFEIRFDGLLVCHGSGYWNSFFSQMKPMAIIQTCSRLRSVALGLPQIWRTIGTVSSIAAGRRPLKKTVGMLCLSALRSGHTLDRVKLRSHDECQVACASKMLDLLSILNSSAESLRDLQLPALPLECGRWKYVCSCQRCNLVPGISFEDKTSARNARYQEVWNAVFKLLGKAQALKHLIMDLNIWTLSPQLEQPFAISARLQSLKLYLDAYRPSPELVSTFTPLVNELKVLHIEIKRWHHTVANVLVSALVQAASSSLEELHVTGPSEALGLSSWLQPGSPLPSLQELRINASDDQRVLLVPGDAASVSLPTLIRLEAPAFLLHYLATPKLENVATSVDSTQLAVVILKLLEWTNVRELVLQFQDDPTIVSRAIRYILSQFAISSGSGYCSCPNLERLSIIGRKPQGAHWLTEVAFKENNNTLDDAAQCRRWIHSPAIGLELYNLSETRRKYPQSPVTAQVDQEDSALATNQDPILKTIHILDCLVDPLVWRLLKQSSIEPPHVYCHPDPLELQSVLAHENRYNLLSTISEALYTLNADPM